MDPAALSAEARFERDLELHHVRIRIFRAETLRIWERRTTGASALGDALFHLFTRDFAPLPERLASIAARLEGAPRFLKGYRSRAVGAQVRPWLEIELRASANVPRFLDEIWAAADLAAASASRARAERRRLRSAIDGAKVAIEDQAEWIEEILPGATPDWPIGAERYERAVAASGVRWPRRRRDPRDRLGRSSSGTTPTGAPPRARSTRTPPRWRSSSGSRTITRTTFEEALEGYRRDMARARGAPHRARPRDDPARRAGRGHPDARVPARRHALRGVLRAGPLGSIADRHVRRDPIGRRSPRRPARALPGGDQQHEHPRGLPGPPPAARPRGAAPVADPRPGRRPGVRRGLGHVQRADAPRARLRRRAGVPRRARDGRDLAGRPDRARRPDAPRRAVDRGGDRRSSIEHTGFERPNALAEARRYTYTPTYNLSYLLGKVLLLHLREDEGSAGSGARSRCATSTTRCSAAARCRSASTAGRCAARAAPPAPGGVARVQVIPAIDVERGRSRIVFWPGVSTGIGAPTDRPERIAEHFVSLGAPLIHIVDFDGARRGAPVNTDAIGAIASRDRDATPARGRPRLARGDPGRLRRRRDARRRQPRARRRPGAPAGVRRRRRRLARDRARRAGGSARARFRGTGRRRRRCRTSSPSSPGAASDGSSSATRPARPRSRSSRRSPDRSTSTSSSRAASTTSRRSVACATRAQRASSSARRSCPGRSTTRPPERLPHELHHAVEVAASRHEPGDRARDAARRQLDVVRRDPDVVRPERVRVAAGGGSTRHPPVPTQPVSRPMGRPRAARRTEPRSAPPPAGRLPARRGAGRGRAGPTGRSSGSRAPRRWSARR